MEKLTVQSLDIYDVFIDKNKNIEKRISDDFYTDNFLHYPLLVNNDGSLWKYGNLYILSKLKSYKEVDYLTLDTIANELKLFMIFCKNEEIDYLTANRKLSSPTYQYREYLNIFKKPNGKNYAPETIKKKMNIITSFYEYLIEVENISFKAPLWLTSTSSFAYKDKYGNQYIKKIESKDVSRVRGSINPDLFYDNIIDGGRLKPLTLEEQMELLKALKNINNTEMLLGFLFALCTGARIQTVFTLRVKHFKETLNENDKEALIKVGYGTDCDTKNNKMHLLRVPKWIYNKIQIYMKSQRFKDKQEKAKHIFCDLELQYIFLNNRGLPYYAAKGDSYRKLYKKPLDGNAVRIFIRDTLKEELKKEGSIFHLSFHDLRATFGMNKLDSLMHLVEKEIITLQEALFTVRDYMGHEDLSTTERYLKFRKKNKIREEAQDDFEEYARKIIEN